ncbi:MAG: Asp-tRNA(Asn)/Glu-tRNA(Gln) amidotransferase subunit GatB [Halobacteriota archaeon]
MITERTDVVIGLEVHVQLTTQSKLFCGCSTHYQDSEPNTHTCPICLGLPGSLPVINEMAVVYAERVAKALNCSVQRTQFYRKNYYYPDLPKGFQISQYDFPLGVNGYMVVDSEGKERKIRINRVHIEEDPGKLTYRGTIEKAQYSLIDYNRSGVPLLEVVTEPDLRTPKEARRFINKLRNILEYLDVFDGNLEGSLRVDANVSIAGGKRAEVKNISSYKGVEKALLFEITRQRNLLRRGIRVTQETRHFDEARGITISLRSKEQEHDYRYFPEPDLAQIDPEPLVKRFPQETEIELPDAKRARFVEQYGISDYLAKVLTASKPLAYYFETVAACVDPAAAASWVVDILQGELNYRSLSLNNFKPSDLIDVIKSVTDGIITEKAAVEVIRSVLDQTSPSNINVKIPSISATASTENVVVKIIEEQALHVVPTEQITTAVKQAIEENPQAVADYRGGKKGALNFLVGQVMKKTRGRADPTLTNRLIQEQL